MMAIVKQEDGRHYTSCIFGTYCKITGARGSWQEGMEKLHNRFFLVFDRDKTKLIKVYIYPWEEEYLAPKILILDTEDAQWRYLDEEKKQGCVDFLEGLDTEAEEITLTAEQLKKCHAMENNCSYEPYSEIRSEKDAQALLTAAGYFHDGYVKSYTRTEDCVYVLIKGCWGCSVELWFVGNPEAVFPSEAAFDCTEYWFEATILHENGRFYLVDGGDYSFADISAADRCFSGERMKYHIIPFDPEV